MNLSPKLSPVASHNATGHMTTGLEIWEITIYLKRCKNKEPQNFGVTNNFWGHMWSLVFQYYFTHILVVH